HGRERPADRAGDRARARRDRGVGGRRLPAGDPGRDLARGAARRAGGGRDDGVQPGARARGAAGRAVRAERRPLPERARGRAARVIDPAKRVPFGRTPLLATRVGLGTAALGGLYAEVGEATAVETVRRAFDRGLRFFDTAPLYGHGLSEQRVGRGLGGLPRDD